MPDLSGLHPQALSMTSWLVRLPGLRQLTHRVAWWNPLWIESFELMSVNRPEVCEDLLNAALPNMPGVPGDRWMRGYVWRGGFTINRITPWANGLRAMGTGQFSRAGVVTYIDFRVALGRCTAYALAVLAAFFLAIAPLILVAMVLRGRIEPLLLLFGAFSITLPLGLAVTAGRMPSADHRRSEEADRLLAFLHEVIGAEPQPARP